MTFMGLIVIRFPKKSSFSRAPLDFCYHSHAMEVKEPLAFRIRPETLDDIIEEVKQDMCDHYCKWPNLWVEEIEGTTLEDGKCADCPLGRLS